ncbi:MAG: hypothetical protein HY706_18190 [Candidatus Hydrogenedentes bacterium]|nr:hypothetical protein [Candidatus Hydrogenedentota bacterium]
MLLIILGVAILLVLMIVMRDTAVAPGHNSAGDRLRISGLGKTEVIAVAPGTRLSLGGEPVEVRGIRAWSGLLRDPRGSPMAEVSLRIGDGVWQEHVFLKSGEWMRLMPNFAAYFAWVESRGEAESRIVKDGTGLESARWGVVEGEAVNWFDSFAPGTGLELADGSTITLLAFNDAHPTSAGPTPAIRVSISRDGDAEESWVTANDPKSHPKVWFEYFARLPVLCRLFAWEDGRVLAAAQSDRYRGDAVELVSGSKPTVRAAGYELRLDQVAQGALPVFPDESTAKEIILSLPERELHVREGEAVTWDDYRIEFIPGVTNYPATGKT